MLFRTHVLFGVFVWLILERVLEMPAFVLAGVLVGAIFVDLDSCSSKIARRFWFVSWIFRHRGVLHSLMVCLGLSLVVGVFSLWLGFGFFVGYSSHLILDCLTLRGVALFWPLGWRCRGFVRSGGLVEDVLFVVLLGAVLVLVVIWIL